jgi:serine/threonine protein kinase/dipeptidyl aminopeptidase/acylaminoacyl peptidase
LERLHQIEEIFQEALQHDPAERDTFVREACRGDAELQREVASLLANHHSATGFAPWAAAAAAQLIDAPSSLQPGQSLGPYRIESFLAAGGMGEVYRATDTRLNRQVAIKVSAARFSERFEREARLIASLNHPNICQLYDVGPNYLVMEFVEGTPLKGPLGVKKAVEYSGQILEALDAAHRKGITHRDLKPANILVIKQGIKLLDFGLAKQSAPVSETEATRALTQQGQIAGTLQYMSPEQLQGKEADARSDLFSFGCVLYEMLTGKRAFEGQSAASVIAAILEREPAPLDLSPPLERVIRTCLAKDPDHRFQNALDLKRDLSWAVEEPIAAKTDRRTWITAAAALALTAVGGWRLSHFHQPPTDDRVLRLQIDPPLGGHFVLSRTTVGDLAISPDGKMAVYTASVNRKIGLWVRPLNGGAATLLPGTENAQQPFWSPDSKSIAFVIPGAGLRRLVPGGGMPSTICGFITAMRAGAWGSDGDILFTAMMSGSYGVYRVPASGGTPSLVAAPDRSRGELAYRWPQVLPDGRFLYVAEGSKPETSGVYAASLTRPAERVKVLTTTTRALYASTVDGAGYLLWTRARALAAQEFNPHKLQLAGEPRVIAEAPNGVTEEEMPFAVSDNGLLLHGAFGEGNQLAWFDRTGKLLGEVGEPMDILGFRLSPDERQIAVERGGTEHDDIWLLDAERGISSRLTADHAYTTHPIWSPDGRTILFYHLGSPELLRKAVNGVGEEQIVAERLHGGSVTDWSGDGRWVLTVERNSETEGYGIWKWPVTPEGKMREGGAATPYLRTRFNHAQGYFSPEPSPRWVAYVSDESGRREVYIDAFPEPRGKKRISTAGGDTPQWGASSRELFYISPENKLMAVGLKFADTVEPSPPRELFALPLRIPAGPPYEPSRDGRRFLMVTNPEAARQPLTVIVNWPALLKKGSSEP